MRKIIYSLLALLLIAGGAYAHTISYDPQNGMSQILVPVFNNAGATVSAGDVVIWQIGSSAGDDDAYITTTTTADTGLVAGVVWPADIADQSNGSIAIWGLVQCDVAGGVNNGSILCSSATAGESRPCTTESGAFGIAVTEGSDTKVNCFVGNLP